MRTLALLFVLALPPLAACGAAYAKASSADIGKPVCTHFDDAAKSADASAKTDPGTASAANATNGTATSPMAAAPAQATIKSGGSSGALHQHSSPRWQAFLPGMFR
jgi:hypothetical protein